MPVNPDFKRIKRVELARGVEMYLGRCEDVLDLHINFVDSTITDPPYNKYTHIGAVVTKEEKDQGLTEFDALENFDFVKPVVTKTKNWALFCCELEDLGSYRAECSNRYVRGAVWDRLTNTPQVSGDRPAQGAEGIAIFHGKRKNMVWNGRGKAGIFRHSVERRHKRHPTQKPLSLMMELVMLFSQPGDIVFDPFVGSGTTGVACVNQGRRFIGVELNPTYFELACERIKAALREPNLFVRKPSVKHGTLF